jgi:transcriptional regulator with XRE-family HTH domain
MRAINKLKKSGLSRGDIARAIGVTRQAVGFWDRGLRSPEPDSRDKLIELALSRGILLLASDFSLSDGESNNES